VLKAGMTARLPSQNAHDLAHPQKHCHAGRWSKQGKPRRTVE
jgi:hypothetical protein